MKKFKGLLILMTMSFAFGAFAQAGVSRAKIVELGIHRLERLVTLKKISPIYLTYFKEESVEDFEDATGAKYRLKLKTSTNSEGLQSELTLFMDAQGRTLRFETVDQAEPLNQPKWPDKDPTTLTETALHYILDEAAVNEKVLKYDQGLLRLQLSRVNTPSGEEAVVEFFKSEVDQSLRAHLSMSAVLGLVEFIELN